MSNLYRGVNRDPSISQPGIPDYREQMSGVPPLIAEEIENVRIAINKVIGNIPETDKKAFYRLVGESNQSADQGSAGQQSGDQQSKENTQIFGFYMTFISSNQQRIQTLLGVMRFIVERVFGDKATPTSVIPDTEVNFTEEEIAFILGLLKNYGFNNVSLRIRENVQDPKETTSNCSVSLVKQIEGNNVHLQDQPIIKALAFCVIYEMFIANLMREKSSVENRITDQQEGILSLNTTDRCLNDPNFSALWLLYLNALSKPTEIFTGNINSIGIHNMILQQLKDFFDLFEKVFANSCSGVTIDYMAIFLNRVANSLHQQRLSSNKLSMQPGSNSENELSAYDYFYNPIINILQVCLAIIFLLKNKLKDKKG